ncbi:Endonuclease/exonuclease/phosphatase [Jimgerdemannia flammicorona]|uniref:Endonuclease/exonuclease/phosphatase n=1 Tax=Jimgerdemannia flammicorona TaxID=994334 RepID=A0A433CVP6_9FUNG|nr:Endonuclease/exonuclease/phosphatase [Jimgerdemannia flammicorona]
MRNRDFAALAERLVFVVEDNEADLARGQNPASISKGKKRQAPREDAAEPLLVNPDTSSDSKPRHRSLRTIYDSDYTFLFGDLNYRISLTAPGSAPITIPLLLGLITDALPDLRPYDQLTIERANQRTLQGFFEGPLSFPPTYKFVVGTEDEYQSTLRIPSWCDRILWWHRMPLPTPIGTGALEVIAYADSASAQHPGKPNADSTPLRRLSSLGPNPALHAQPLTLHTYTSHGSYRFSDHKPVSALFTVCPSALPPRAASARPPRSHDNVDMYWRVKRVVGTSMDHAAGYSWLVATTRVGRLVLLGMLALGGWAALELWASR